jgi:acyl carrier protein
MAAEEETIREVLRKHGHRVPGDADLSLGEDGLALDSIAMVELLLDLEERFGVAIADDLLQPNRTVTVGSIAAYVRARRSP